MEILFTISILFNAFLAYLVWYRFREERNVIKDVLSLTATEKGYVVLAMNNETIDPGNLPASDVELLQDLSERGWLFPMGDGTFAGGATTKAEYLARRIKD